MRSNFGFIFSVEQILFVVPAGGYIGPVTTGSKLTEVVDLTRIFFCCGSVYPGRAQAFFEAWCLVGYNRGIRRLDRVQDGRRHWRDSFEEFETPSRKGRKGRKGAQSRRLWFNV